VVLEAGGGSWSLHWALVQPEVAKFARVLAYDRAGSGWSDPGPLPRTSERIATELHALLRAARLPPPYVLVGHSSGGYHVRVFASQNPKEVAGLVLVDPSTEERPTKLTDVQQQELADRALRQGQLRSAAARLGAVRLYLACAPPESVLRENAKLPEGERAKELALVQLPENLMGSAYEGTCGFESARQAGAASGPGDLPLAVLTAERDGLESPGMKERLRMHAKQARLSHRGRHVTVPGSGHLIPLDQPGAVIESIRAVVEQARHKEN
jgi:pimeloyl-ACP methyl ester carboxylesterase